MPNTTVFTYADANYFRFVAPFIYFWFRTNPEVAVEVIVSDYDAYMRWNGRQVEFLEKHFSGREFLIREQTVSRDIIPNTVRFVEEPQIISEYTYIADIDILVMETNIIEQHLGEMRRTGLPYSNIKRDGIDKLSGLHFTSSSAYYPVPDLHDLDLSRENDEAILYQIVKRKGVPISDSNFRPVHGIHVSYNRPPVMEDGAIPGWGITKEYLECFRALTTERLFAEFEMYLDKGMQNTLDRIRTVGRLQGESASSAAVAFGNIYQTNEWGASSSRSGPGSTWSATKLLRHQIRRAISELNIRTMLDAPCGDANWICEVAQHLDLYIGIDIVPQLIASNAVFHAERNMAFKVADLTTDQLPKVDAIFSRDCLVHLPLEMAMDGLRRFVFSGSTYLICTTFTGTKENLDTVRPGPWRQLNLEIAPFNFPPPVRLICERTAGEPYADKSMGIWRLDDLRHLLETQP
jgi:hypothetical protein